MYGIWEHKWIIGWVWVLNSETYTNKYLDLNNHLNEKK